MFAAPLRRYRRNLSAELPSRDSGCEFGAFMVRPEERSQGKGGAYQYSSADGLYCEEWAANESSSAADASRPTLASSQRLTDESRVCRCRRLALATGKKERNDETLT